MKKLTSIALSSLLAFTMVGSCITVASAADSGTTLTSTTGSLTLTKYDSTNVKRDEATGTLSAVEGSEAATKTKNLSGDELQTALQAYVVKGATFTAYRVLDLDSNGYSVNDAFKSSGITVENLIVTDTSTDPATTSYPSYGTYGTTTELEEQISMLQNYATSTSYTGTQDTDYYNLTDDDNDGTYSLTDKTIGVYLVVETAVPTSKDSGVNDTTASDTDDTAYVISTQSFLVAIPQWDQDISYDTSTGAVVDDPDNYTGDTTHWNYNISAYPKDQSIELTKEMDTADTTDDDATTTADSYEIGDTIPYTVTATIPNYGKSSDYPDLTVTQNLSANYVDGDGTAAPETGLAMYNNLSLSFTDTLSKGLMLDKSTLKVSVAGTQLTNGEEVTSVNATSTTTAEEKEAAIYAALKKAAKSLASATYDKDTGEYTAAESTTGANYTYYVETATDGTTKMYVYVPWVVLDSTTKGEYGNQGNKIVLNYSASLTNEAVQGTAENNDVTYSYQNNPQTTKSDAYDPNTTNEDKTYVYTYGMELTKLFDGAAASTVADADNVTFQLFAGDDTGYETPLTFVKNSDNTYTLFNSDAVKDGKVQAVDTDLNKTATVTDLNPSGGVLTVKGLAAGTYNLKETASVQGYSILTDPVTIVVSEVKDTEKATEDNPEGLIGDVSATINDNTTVIETLSTKAEAVLSDNPDATVTDAQKATFVLSVNNSKNQFNLPLTGGLGLWIFTIAGGVIMAAAIIVFAVSRKKKASK